MLQKLLADRFHLELHRENRLSSVYELTLAKAGLKLRTVPVPSTPALPSGNAPSEHSPVLQWGSAGEKTELHGRGATIRQLLIWLTEETGREIVDKTGLTEAYDFDMLWTRPSSTEPNDGLLAATLDSAIEKYLGLKVIARKVPVEMLVIDRLDRSPVEN